MRDFKQKNDMNGYEIDTYNKLISVFYASIFPHVKLDERKQSR